MPIVFVHGVNTRREEQGYASREALMRVLFENHLRGATIDGKVMVNATPSFPYWGDLGITFAWNMASLPSGDIDNLGATVPDNLRALVATIEDLLPKSKDAAREPLLGVARQSLPVAVELLSELLIQQAADIEATNVAALILQMQRYAEVNPSPAWLAGLTTDAQFLGQLLSEVSTAPAVGQPQSLGVFNALAGKLQTGLTALRDAVTRASMTILDRTGDFASTKLLGWTRSPLNAVLGRFFGDVFVYLDKRGETNALGPITQRVSDEFSRAAQAAGQTEPLVIVGHSLGGVISFDILSYFRKDLQVDLFITVGSQVSHFEEIKRFRSSDAKFSAAAGNKAPTPPNIKRWINVYDEVDIFSYACGKIFDRVTDFRYDTHTYVIKAHGAYLEQDGFFARLRARIDDTSK